MKKEGKTQVFIGGGPPCFSSGGDNFKKKLGGREPG